MAVSTVTDRRLKTARGLGLRGLRGGFGPRLRPSLMTAGTRLGPAPQRVDLTGELHRVVWRMDFDVVVEIDEHVAVRALGRSSASDGLGRRGLLAIEP